MGLREIRRELKDACHDWKVANYKVVNGCTLLGLTEESDFSSWEAAMGSDPVHLTDAALGTMAGLLCEMAEGNDAMFSGGKRALEDRRTDRRRLSREGSRGSTDPARDEAAVEDKAAGEVPGEVSPLVGYGARGYSSSGSGYGGYNNSGYGNSGYGNKKR